MITPFMGHFVTVNVRSYNVIVVASNDNESSQVTLPGFSICVPVPVIRGLTRFLTMAEVILFFFSVSACVSPSCAPVLCCVSFLAPIYFLASATQAISV